jgi:hypothetical protein
MDIAALILWILTAGGGSYLLGTWVAKGGARRDGAQSRFPAPLIFGHFLLAAVGLVLWIVYVAADSNGIGWTAFGLLLAVALLGFTMLARWIPTYRAARGGTGTTTAAPASYGAAGGTTTMGRSATTGPAEQHFPVAVVAAHGLLAATTLVLVLLTMAGVGGS